MFLKNYNSETFQKEAFSKYEKVLSLSICAIEKQNELYVYMYYFFLQTVDHLKNPVERRGYIYTRYTSLKQKSLVLILKKTFLEKGATVGYVQNDMSCSRFSWFQITYAIMKTASASILLLFAIVTLLDEC